MKADHVITLQRDLCARLNNRKFQQTVSEVLKPSWSVAADLQTIQGIPDQLQSHVHDGYAYHVTEDMCTVVEAAAAGLHDTDVYSIDMPPTMCGFIIFDRGLPVCDLRGNVMLLMELLHRSRTCGKVIIAPAGRSPELPAWRKGRHSSKE